VHLGGAFTSFAISASDVSADSTTSERWADPLQLTLTAPAPFETVDAEVIAVTPHDQMYTPAQVSALLQVSRTKTYQLLAHGEIGSVLILCSIQDRQQQNQERRSRTSKSRTRPRCQRIRLRRESRPWPHPI